MKKIMILAFSFCISFMIVNIVYAQNNSKVTVVDSYTEKFENNEYVIKITDFTKKCLANIKSGWAGFKRWFNHLPGIKEYNDSVYSSKNWKKTMDEMSEEYKPHLQKNSAGVNMLKEGKKKWDNL